MERIKLTEMLEYLRQKRKKILDVQRKGEISDDSARKEEDMILAIMEAVRETDAQYLSLADRLVDLGYVERKRNGEGVSHEQSR